MTTKEVDLAVQLDTGLDKSAAPDLPEWLNPYQLEAWVRWRDSAVVKIAEDWNGLAGQAMYGGVRPTGSMRDLLKVLQGGQLSAMGRKDGGTFEPIPAVEWTRIALAPLDLSRQHPYQLIHFKRQDVLAIFPATGGTLKGGQAALGKGGRAPSVKMGRPPSDLEILKKADEMKARGLTGRQIASQMRFEDGYENVLTTEVRKLIKGHFKPSGRPKQNMPI